MIRDFIYTTSSNEKVGLTIYGFDSISENPVIICVHGFKGFKDWGFWPYIGKYFSENGFTVVTINFSHNGIADGKDEITDIEKFSNNTFSLEINELKEIIHLLKSDFWGSTKNNKIGLLGHSRGGAEAILSASDNNEVDAVTTLAAISKLDRFTKRQKNEWRKTGFWEVVNSRTGQVMKLNLPILEDVESNKHTTLNVESALKNLNKPLLIIHGTEDLTVPIAEAELLYQWSDKNLTKFIKVEHCGHTFNIQHPFTNSNKYFDIVLSEVLNFFNKNLKHNNW
jgi:pimeloyl-ACP methyl ester carboxylesterase